MFTPYRGNYRDVWTDNLRVGHHLPRLIYPRLDHRMAVIRPDTKNCTCDGTERVEFEVRVNLTAERRKHGAYGGRLSERTYNGDNASVPNECTPV